MVKAVAVITVGAVVGVAVLVKVARDTVNDCLSFGAR